MGTFRTKKTGILFLLILTLALSGCKETKEALESYEEGLAYIETQEYKKAGEAFSKAVMDKDSKKVQSLNKKAYYGAGVAYYRQGKNKKALEEFEKALKISYLEGWNTQIRKYIIDIMCSQENYEEAYDSIVLVRKEQPEDFDLLFKEYFVLLELAKEEEAKEVLNGGLKIKGRGAEYDFDKAKIYYYLGNREKAKEGMTESAEKEMNEAYLFLGRICQEEEDCEGAIKNYNIYIKDADNPGGLVYNLLADAYIALEDYENAAASYEDGIALCKENGDSIIKELLFNQIVLLENQGEFEKALKKCSAYLKAYPDDEAMKREFDFLDSRSTDGK